MNEEIKALLEELQLPEETATSITTMLSEAFEKAKEDGKAEGKEEAMKDADAKAAEKDEEKDEEIKNLKEMANEYGEFLKEKANAYGDHVKEVLGEKMKEYADFAIEQFITENKERFVETEEYARMRGTFDLIKEAYEQNAFDVRVDAVAQDLQKSLEESTDEYEKVFEALQKANEEVVELKRTMILERATADLADTQKEKVNELLEAVSFDTVEEYADGLALIVEQTKANATATKTNAAATEILNEGNGTSGAKAIDPNIARYLGQKGLL